MRPDWYGTFYRKNIVMCLYCKITLSNKPIRQLPSQDYVDGGRDTGRLTTFWFVHKYKASRTQLAYINHAAALGINVYNIT